MQVQNLNSVNNTKQLLAIGHSKLYELLSSGTLQAVKLGRKTLVTGESINQYVASLPVATFGHGRGGVA